MKFKSYIVFSVVLSVVILIAGVQPCRAAEQVRERIVYASFRPAAMDTRDGDHEIYTLDIDKDGKPGELRRVTRSPGFDTHPVYSPDGKWLVFTSQRGGLNDEEPLLTVFNPQPYGEVFAVRLSDGMVFRLTHNKWEDGTPTWMEIPR